MLCPYADDGKFNKKATFANVALDIDIICPNRGGSDLRFYLLFAFNGGGGKK
jgi:hypothetical protein